MPWCACATLVSIRLLRGGRHRDVIDYAARFGFDRAAMPNNLTLALGTVQATPLQVATGYAAFAQRRLQDRSVFHRPDRGRHGARRSGGPRRAKSAEACVPPPDQAALLPPSTPGPARRASPSAPRRRRVRAP